MNYPLDRLQTRTVDILICDLCGKQIGWVYEFDLNESYFYCDECKVKHDNSPKDK